MRPYCDHSQTLEGLQAWMAQPEGGSPFQNVGGYNGIDADKSGWMDLDLTPGAYVAICHIPDPASGKAHELLGMVMPFMDDGKNNIIVQLKTVH